jgi:hypothetical protein
MRIARGRSEEAVPFLQELADDSRARNDAWLLGHALTVLAMTRSADDGGVADSLTEAVAALRRSGDTWSVAYALMPLGNVALLAGDLPGATTTHEEALTLARSVDDDHLIALALDQLAFDALFAGDLDGAAAHVTESAGLHRRLHGQEGVAYALDVLAGLALAQGQPHVAARMAGSADAARASLGVAVWPLLQSLADQFAAALRSTLGEDEAQQDTAAGAATDPWEALEEGLAAVHRV